MNDPREVPPTPGTEPRLWKEYLRPYREEAGIYSRHRREGTIPRTEGEVEALIRTNAADLAATKEPSPHTPPFLYELVSTFWHRLFRNNEVRRRELAASLEGQRMAQLAQAIAEEKVERSNRRARELASERKRMDKPVTGVTLTQPEVLFLCLIPGIVIEVFGSAPSLDAAFELGKYPSWGFAAAISIILILAAEQLGNTLASAAASSRRRAGWVAAALVTVAVGAGIFALVSLAESRATNLAYQQGGELNISPANSNGSFGTAVAPDKPAAAGVFGQQEETAPQSPDYDFFIPLSILVMATAMLVAYRIEMAQDWNEVARAIEDAEGDVDEAREEREEALADRRRAVTPENEVLLGTSAVVEREHGLLTLWIARFLSEYHRFCAAIGQRPQRFAGPTIPEVDEVLERVLDPRAEREAWRASQSRPEEDGGSDHSGNGWNPGPEPGTGPAADGSEDANSAEDDGDPDFPPPDPEAGPGGTQRHDSRGGPRRFGGSG